MGRRVLLVDDDAPTIRTLAAGLTRHGFEVIEADSVANSSLAILKSPPNIILADFQLQDGTAFDLLAWLKDRDLRIPLIVITGYASIDMAVEAVKKGADGLIPKPVDIGYVAAVLQRTVDSFRILQKDLVNKLERARYERDPFLGNSSAILTLKKEAKRVAETNSTVLIQGETGTGKGVLARWLHKLGLRSNEPFVDLNCAGLSSELFQSELFGHQKGAFTGAVTNKIGFLEAADCGTLFLDEIGDMDLHVQPKILKVVEDKRFYRLGDVNERKVDVQIIAATHNNLKKQAEVGAFRRDLYFRLSTMTLCIPSLRDRIEDIPTITDKLLEQFSWEMKRGPLKITDRARSELLRYSWPGNIRELRNVLERAALLSEDGIIDKTGLEFDLRAPQALPPNGTVENLTLREVEKRYIVEVLGSFSGCVTQAAQTLGLPRSTLYSKIREYGLLQSN